MAAYSDITEDVLSVIKAPPVIIKNNKYYSDASFEYNNIQHSFFQFRLRYVYDDNEKSVWSHISNIGDYGGTNYKAAFNLRYTAYGYENPALSKYMNQLRFDIDIPNDPTLMKLEIAARRGNNGAWFLYDTIDISGERGNNNYQLYFYNDKLIEFLNQEDVVRPYDYVPPKASTLKIIGKNRLVFGGIFEGYDNNIALNVSFSSTDSDLSLGNGNDVWDSGDTPFTQAEGYPIVKKISNHYYKVIYEDWLVTDYKNIEGTFVIIITAENVSYEFISDRQRKDYRTFNQTVDQIINDMLNCPVIETAWRLNDELYIRFKAWVDYETEDVVANVHHGIPVDKSLKDGATHYFGIVYSDKYGRIAPVLRNDDTKFYIDFCTESGKINKKYTLNYSISHTPPDWATHWRIVYGRNSLLWFQQFLLRTHDEDDKSIWREDGYTKIKINEGINNVRDVVENFILENYSFQKGDRLRIIGTKSDKDKTDTLTLVSSYIDMEIISFDGIYIYTTDWVNINNTPDLDNITDDILIEIYRMRPESENPIYYGIGHVFEINNPGKSNRTHANASGTIYIADCYATYHPLAYYLVQPIEAIEGFLTTSTTTTTTYTDWKDDQQTYPCGIETAMVMSMCQSPFIPESNQYDLGEPHIANPDYKEQKLNNICYSGPFIARSQINELNRFDYDDVIEMDDKHGTIYGLEEIGYTLKVLQTSKNTSVYIGYEYYTDSDGSVKLISTNKVLGSKNPHPENYGTIFSKSIVKVGGDIFYYDIYAGKIIRCRGNGQQVVSMGGIDSYLRSKSRTLLNSGVSNINVIAGVDEKNGVVYFTFIDSNDSSNNETIGFHVWDNRWMGNYVFIPELYSGMGENMFVGFKDGEFYKFNSDSVNRNYFFGEQSYSEIHIVSNINPQALKQWDSIEICSNKLWTIAENDSLVIDPSTRYPGGMKSKILSGDWQEYEEVFRTAFNYDMLTGDNATADAYYLHNGRELRGRNMLIKLKNEDTSEVNLIFIKVNSKMSR